MKNFKLPFLLTLVTTLAVIHFSCNENTVGEDLTIVKGFNYYPLEIGKYITYKMDSIVYGQVSGAQCEFFRDTSSYYLREEVVDTFTDNTGDLVYTLERFIKVNEDDPWRVVDVWVTKMTDSQVEKVEENLRFIKMVFPVREGASWSGNTYFQDTSVVIGSEIIDFYGFWSSEYEYDLVDVPEEINGIQFDSVMTVFQSQASDNRIHHRVSTEKYARNVGLIYKEMLILDTQCCEGELNNPDSTLFFCDTIPWVEKAEKGLIFKQEVIDFN
ncbi:MAG: hypothetical protein AAF573_21715 [Bacteroidota bacterium]